MCGLKKIFEGAGNFFKKVPANHTFPFGKNQIQSILLKICLKDLPLIRFAYGSAPSPEEKALKPFRQATLATFPFRDGFRVGKAPMKGELSRSD